MSFEKQENTEQLEQQENNKSEFEKDFGYDVSDKKKEPQSPAMKVIAENYDAQNPALMIDNVINEIAGKELSGLNSQEKEEFENLKQEFVEELKFDENGKITEEGIKMLAEKINDLSDFISGIVGGKARTRDQQNQELENIETNQKKANLDFDEKMKNFMNKALERKIQEQTQRADNTKKINKAGKIELAISGEKADNLLEAWPPDNMQS